MAVYFKSKPSMDINGNKMWAISKDVWRVITLNGHLDKSSTVICSNANSTLRGLFDDAIDVVQESGNLFAYSKDGPNGKILKQQLSPNGCPTGSSLSRMEQIKQL